MIERLGPATAKAAFLGLLLACLEPAAAGAKIPCKCRYAGHTVLLGDCVCMNRGNGLERACCGKVLNNTSWTFFDDGCPVAARERPRSERGAGAARPIDAMPARPRGLQRAVLPTRR